MSTEYSPWAPRPDDPETMPPTPAAGRNGRWVKLGQVGVDSATLAITDPAFADKDWHKRTKQVYTEHSGRYGHMGVSFMAGFGDGSYDVWGWVVDYGQVYEGETEWTPDERVSQIKVTLIDDEALKHWRSN